MYKKYKNVYFKYTVYRPRVSHSGVMESCATIRKGCYYDLCSLNVCLLLAGFYKYKMAISLLNIQSSFLHLLISLSSFIDLLESLSSLIDLLESLSSFIDFLESIYSFNQSVGVVIKSCILFLRIPC